MGYASGHLTSVSLLTHRPLPSAALAARVTSVRGREVYKLGHAPGGCDHCQDRITGIMERMPCLMFGDGRGLRVQPIRPRPSKLP
jgi:hypothetical protein